MLLIKPSYRPLLGLALLFILAQSAQSQFTKFSFEQPTSGPDFRTNLIPAGGNRIAYVYFNNPNSADGTPEGTTNYFESLAQKKMVTGPLDYVFYTIRAKEWKYLNSATKTTILIKAYNSSGYPLFSSADKSFSAWHIPGFYQIDSYDPITNVVSTVLTVPDTPEPVEFVLFDNQVVARTTLHPPNYGATNAPRHLFVASDMNTMFFSYGDPSANTGLELWKTDDLTTYTLVADLNPGAGGSDPRFFCEVPEVGVFFFANPTNSLLSLFWTDGIDTLRLHDFTVSLTGPDIPIVRVRDRVVFIVTLADNSYHAWSSDGTVEGTVELHTALDFQGALQLASTGDYAVFYNTGLYQTDGTLDGTFQIPYLPTNEPNAWYANLTAIGRDFYVTTHDVNQWLAIYKYTPNTFTNNIRGQYSRCSS